MRGGGERTSRGGETLPISKDIGISSVRTPARSEDAKFFAPFVALSATLSTTNEPSFFPHRGMLGERLEEYCRPRGTFRIQYQLALHLFHLLFLPFSPLCNCVSCKFFFLRVFRVTAEGAAFSVGKRERRRYNLDAARCDGVRVILLVHV